MIPRFKKVYSTDYEVNKLQSNSEEVLTALTTSPFINGIFINATIKVTDTIIEHKLQRDYQGWAIVDIDANSVVFRSSTVNNNKDRQIILIASVQTNVTIYIF